MQAIIWSLRLTRGPCLVIYIKIAVVFFGWGVVEIDTQTLNPSTKGWLFFGSSLLDLS